MDALQQAFDDFRRRTHGDMTGAELAAFANLAREVKASPERAPSAFPDIWCKSCNAIQPMVFDVMRADDRNDHDAADLVCEVCHFLVATLHAKRS